MPDLTPANPATPAPVVDPATPNPAPVDPSHTPATPAVDPAPAADPANSPPSVADPAKGYWPEDWRQKYAGEDPKLLKRLERFASPDAALDALIAAQAKISAGVKDPLKADATPEELAAWRAENGVPETPDAYELKLTDGLIIGDSDKPFVDEFLTIAHAKNMDSATVSTAVDWFLGKQQELIAEQAERDGERRVKTFEALREEFGPQYKTEVKVAMQALESAAPGVKDAFLAGRLADGTMIGDSPEIIRWLNSITRQLNPVGVVVPGSGTNAVQAAEAERDSLRKMMGDRKSDYWKGPNAEKNQARYRDLTTALSKGK